MSNIQTGAERMPHDLSHLGFLAGQIGRLITISTTPVIAGDSRSEERFSRNAETDLVCRLLLEKKKNDAQLRAIAAVTNRRGRGIADITTRQQIQLRWIRFEDFPAILGELREVGLVTLQTGMDNIRNIIACPVAGLTRNELFDASAVGRACTDVFVGDQ